MSNPSAPGSSTPPKSPGPGSTSRPGVFAALSHPRYRNFWLGSVASTGAAQLLIMAQGWLVFELSGSPMDLGLLGAAASIPTIAGSVYGGVLADRLDKRRVLIVTSVISALLMWLLAALDASGEVAVWHVLAITAVMALIAALDLPARQAIFPMLIDRAQMMSAIALNSMLWQGTRMIFPAIGGLVIAASDTWVVFAASGFGYVAMVVVLVRLGPVSQPKPVGASMTQMMEGLRFIFTTRLFAVLIPLTYTIMFFGTSFVQLMPLFAAELGTDERGFGVLISASGVGSMAGTLFVGRLQGSKHLGRIMLGGGFAAAAALICFTAVTAWLGHTAGAFYIALVLVVVTGACNSLYLITSMTVLQLNVSDELRGRVMGIHGVTFSMIPLGALLTGWMAVHLGASGAVAIGAGVAGLTVAAVALGQPTMLSLSGDEAQRRSKQVS